MININCSVPSHELVTIKNHVATSWRLMSFPDYTIDSFKLATINYSSNFLVDLETSINSDRLKNNKVYYQYKLHYQNGTESKWSGYKSILVKDYVATDTFIRTPDMKSEVFYSDTLEPYVRLSTTKFTVHTGPAQTHSSTDWSIYDRDGNLIWEETHSSDLLVKELPIKTEDNNHIIRDNNIYTLKVKHRSSLGPVSETGVYTFGTYIQNDTYFKLETEAMFRKGMYAYFINTVLTTEFVSMDIRLKNSSGVVISEENEQVSKTPKVYIPNSNDPNTHTIEARVKLVDGSYTDYQLVKEILLMSNELVITRESDAIDKYDYLMDMTMSNLTVQSSHQLQDGSFLIAGLKRHEIYRYEMVNGVLSKKELAITLPATDLIGMPYVAIIPLYNGRVIVNYGADTGKEISKETVFKLYDYNPVTKKLTELNEHRREGIWGAVSISKSYFVSKESDVYFVPAKEVDASNNVLNLSLYKLDQGSFTTNKVMDLPFEAEYNVSLSPISSTPDKFLILGGSKGYTKKNNRLYWSRDNNLIYTYNHVANDLDPTPIEFPVEFSTDVYNMQTSMRPDGNITIFNATRDNSLVGDQSTVIYNPSNKTFELLDNNLVNITAPFRSIISLRNGDVLRISGRADHKQVVYNYVCDSMSINDIDNGTFIGAVEHLVVPIGEKVDVENIYRFNSIIIEGNETESGILRWQDVMYVKEYGYKTLIVCRETYFTRTEFEALEFEEIIYLSDGRLTIEEI